MKRLLTACLFLSHLAINAQSVINSRIKYSIDIGSDSLNHLRQNARTSTDTLNYFLAKINNIDIDPIDGVISAIDSLVDVNNRLKIIDTRSYELFREGCVLWKRNERKTGIEKMKEAMDLFDRQKTILSVCGLFSGMRFLFSYAGLQEERLKYFSDKLKYYQKNGPVEMTGQCYHAIAGYYAAKEDYNNAISNFLQSAEVIRTLSPLGYCNEMCVTGTYYYLWGNNERAKYLLAKGL